MIHLNEITPDKIQNGRYSSVYFPDDYNNPSLEVACEITGIIKKSLHNQDDIFVDISHEYNNILELLNSFHASSSSLEIAELKLKLLNIIQEMVLKIDSLYTFDAIDCSETIQTVLPNNVQNNQDYCELLTRLINNYISFRLAREKRVLMEASGLTISYLEEYKTPTNLGFKALDISSDLDEKFFDIVYYVIHSLSGGYSPDALDDAKKYVDLQVELMNIFESVLLTDEITPEIKSQIESLYPEERYDVVGCRYYADIHELKHLSNSKGYTLAKKNQN